MNGILVPRKVVWVQDLVGYETLFPEKVICERDLVPRESSLGTRLRKEKVCALPVFGKANMKQ